MLLLLLQLERCIIFLKPKNNLIMKKLIISAAGLVCAALTVVIFSQQKSAEEQLLIENIEALTQGEGGDVIDCCSVGSEDPCVGRYCGSVYGISVYHRK